jgi:hypothetical protein
MKHPAIKDYGGVLSTAPSFLTSALDGGELSASLSGHFTSEERAPSTHWRRLCGQQSRSRAIPILSYCYLINSINYMKKNRAISVSWYTARNKHLIVLSSGM